MKKIVALIITLALVLTALPAFVTKASAASEKTLFQTVYDDIEETAQAREKKVWKDPVDNLHPMFEEIKSKLSSLDEEALKAKKLSLRGNAGEIARRRGVR